MDKEKALKIWDAIFGNNVQWAMDCFGTWMYRDDYGDIDTYRVRPNGDGRKYKYGWEIDHIRPKSTFVNEKESNLYNNYEPVHYINNREKADFFPHFKINNKSFRIVKCDMCSKKGLLGYGIIDEQGKRIDWKGKKLRYFIKN